jgi:hypothetical protein
VRLVLSLPFWLAYGTFQVFGTTLIRIALRFADVADRIEGTNE